MPYYFGRNVKAFISTENQSYGLSLSSAGVLSAAQWASTGVTISDFVVPPLRTASWAGTEADVTGTAPARAKEILDIIGVEPRPAHENEDIDFLGRNLTDHIRVRKTGEAVITRKMGSNDFAIVYDKANAGVTGSGINEADEQSVTDSGFRIYIRVSGGTGSGHTWYTFKNCQMTKDEITPTAAKTTAEQMTFQTNLWSVGIQPDTTPTSASDL